MAVSVDEAVAAGPAPDPRPPARRSGGRGRGRSALEVALLTVLAVVMLFPVLWMIETSIKENRDVYAVPAEFFGFTVTLDHFRDVFVASGGGRSALSGSFLNSVVVAGVSTVLATVLGVPAAWAYSRFTLKAKKDQLFFVLSTRFMPPVVVVVPIFLMYRQVGLIDTKLGLILIYAAFNVPFTIWMMKGFVDEVPAEYEDAAMLDGYTRLQAFWKFTLPCSCPASPRRRSSPSSSPGTSSCSPSSSPPATACVRPHPPSPASSVAPRWTGVWWPPPRWCSRYRCSSSPIWCAGTSSPV